MHLGLSSHRLHIAITKLNARPLVSQFRIFEAIGRIHALQIFRAKELYLGAKLSLVSGGHGGGHSAHLEVMFPEVSFNV